MRQSLIGKKLDVRAAGQRLVQELYFKKAGDEVILLVLQDTPNLDGVSDDETSPARIELGKMLQATLKFASE